MKKFTVLKEFLQLIRVANFELELKLELKYNLSKGEIKRIKE